MIETSRKWASLGLNQGPPDYESVSLGEFNLQMQSNSNLLILN